MSAIGGNQEVLPPPPIPSANSETNPLPNEPPPPYNPTYGAADAVPPSYSSSANNGDQPPSYDSLFGELRAAKSNSSNVLDYFKKFLIIILSTVGCTICVGLVLAVPVSMVVIGSLYFNDCPREKYISIYLIVGGVFGILKNCSNLLQRVRNRDNGQDEENAKSNPFDGTINCFLVAWFIAGNVWVYRIYKDVNTIHTSSPNYCHPTLYYYAFWLINSIYILFGFSTCFFCCMGLMAAFIRSKDPDVSTTPC